MFCNKSYLILLGLAIAVSSYKLTPTDDFMEENYTKIGNYVSNINGVSYASHYYLLKSKKLTKSWNRASEECKRLGGNLAAFETEEEQDYVLNNLPSDSLKNFPHYAYFISIGGFKKNETWYWQGPEADIAMNYEIKWAPSEPNNGRGDENCMNMYKVDGTFRLNDDPCSVKEGAYLCEMQELADYSETMIAEPFPDTEKQVEKATFSFVLEEEDEEEEEEEEEDYNNSDFLTT